PLTLARTLTHLRCWAEALDEKVSAVSPLIILEASAQIPDAWLSRSGAGAWATEVLRQTGASAARGDELLLLAASSAGRQSLAAGYALSPHGLRALAEQRQQLWQVSTDADGLLAQLAQGNAAAGSFFQAWRKMRTASFPLLQLPLAGPLSRAAFLSPPAPPALLPGKRREAVKVILISLPHRSDRRVEPLIGGEPALQAMRDAGFDVEVLRASCYCERDALVKHGSLHCYLDGASSVRLSKYEGADAPLSEEEEEQLREAIDRNY
ncbi:unnamed protein product, partial [Polarella glacialis]